MTRLRSIGVMLLLVPILGCGKELGRVPFTKEGTGSTTVALKPGEVAFWTDIDIEWQGAATLDYEVELLQGGTKVASATCNPLGNLSVKTTWVETNIHDEHSRSGNGKLDCSVTLPSGGTTTVNATLAFGSKGKSVTLKKADLVIKQ